MTNELLEQPKPREDVLAALRKRAVQGATVKELIREIHKLLGLKKDAVVPVLWYFTQAFYLTLPEVLPMREWIGTDQDEELDSLILPALARTRKKWATLKPPRVSRS